MEVLLPSRDAPLWARGVAAALLIGACWWLVHTEALRQVVGDSIALLGLGGVAVSIIRGMHLPLGLWPDGPWRTRFSPGAMALVALVFAALVVAAAPTAPQLEGSVDVGGYVVTVVGVLALGTAWAMVRQRAFTKWFAVALATGLLPAIAVLIRSALRDAGGMVCVFEPSLAGAACPTSAVHAFVFVAVVGTAVGIVTTELAFRRLLIGRPEEAGLTLILLAAGVQVAWVALIGVGIGGVPMPWWLVGLSAVAAGGVYVLSGSLLPSAMLSAAVAGAYAAVLLARPEASVAAPGVEFGAALVVLAAALAAAVARTRGFLGGLH